MALAHKGKAKSRLFVQQVVRMEDKHSCCSQGQGKVPGSLWGRWSEREDICQSQKQAFSTQALLRDCRKTGALWCQYSRLIWSCLQMRRLFLATHSSGRSGKAARQLRP